MPRSADGPPAIAGLSRADRADRGEAARRKMPLEALAEHDTERRYSALDLLEKQAASRIAELMPVRYGRMAATPFAFYRGAALIMADDLSRVPNTGLQTQLCGDAHLSNFGVFATPERKLVFDINDFDETYPGPFEWDVKRLVASLAVASREIGFTDKQRLKVARACAAEYRETMAGLAERGSLEVWYSHIDSMQELEQLREQLDSTTSKRIRKNLEKWRRRDSVQALSKLTAVMDGRRKILSMPPLIVPIEEVFSYADSEQLYREFRQRLAAYRETLPANRRLLFDQFEFVQAARKVVGVGSVGTRVWVLLLLGVDEDPLFLQAKEAVPSVLSGYLAGPSFDSEGQRVVDGQRLMQATSDIFLGWQQGPGLDGTRRDFYLRQLRDGKGSALIEAMSPAMMMHYGRLCARALAYAHARAGDRIAIAAYLGSGTEFDCAVAEFAESYADQNARDHAELLDAIKQGRITAQVGI
jgi:uncharacterized protein (DUF2252 family)